MANEILQKSRSDIECQANSTALTASYDPNSGSYTGATPAVLDNRITGGSDNCKGAYAVSLELNVTTHAGGDTAAEIWYSTSKNNTNYTKWKYSHTVGETILSAATPRVDAGMFYLTELYTKLAVVARSVAFNATLTATPLLNEGQ